jgi:hypothetical protein
MEDREEKEEGQFSSSEQLLFKNLSEAISGCHAPSKQRLHHQGRARSNSHDGALEMAPSQPDRNLGGEEPIISNKRPRYQRRSSFVIRCKNNSPFPPRGLIEGYDDDDGDRPLNRSAPDLFSPQPEEMPSDMEAWGWNLSWSNTNDTASYKFSCMSFEDAEPLIPEPPYKSVLLPQSNTSSGSTTPSPDMHHCSAFVFSSPAISASYREKNAMDTLAETEGSMRVPRCIAAKVKH